MRPLRIGLAAWLLAAAARAATPGVELPPEPAPPRPLVLPAFTERTLPNGLRVVLAPRPGVPIVTAQLLVLAGSDVDPPGQAGLAAMTAGLLTKGARRGGRAVGASELARQAEALGATLESGSNVRSSNLTMTVTTPRLDEALALLADAARQPLLAAPELERARAQSLDALKVTLSSPGDVAAMAARRAWWGASPYGASATPESLRRLTRADVQRFHARWVRPANAVLLLAGDLPSDAALALAARHFGDWSAAAPSGVALPPAAAAAPLAAPLVLIDMPGSGQSSVVLSAPFVASDAADRRAGEVANVVLGGGYSARLSQEIRINRGLTYDVRSEAEAFPAGGLWSAQSQTDHPNAAEVLKLMRAELLRLARDGPAADELAARQALMVGALARRLETTQGLAALLARQIAQGRPLSALADYPAEVMAVTPAQVRDFAARHWAEAGLRGVVAGDIGAAGAALGGADTLRLGLPTLNLESPGLKR